MTDTSPITVVSLPGAWGLPTVSPFCLKLETWMRMAGIPYRQRISLAPFGSPKGKVPYIEWEEGKLGDSQHIAETLSARRGVALETHLTPAEQGHALALRRLIEEHTYFAVVYSRWSDPDGWRQMKPAVFGRLPHGPRQLVPLIARRQVKAQLHQQGTGRHTADEVCRDAAADLKALSQVLGESDWFFRRPTALDASAYGLLANVIFGGVEGPLKAAAHAHANLVAFCERVRAQYWAPAGSP